METKMIFAVLGNTDDTEGKGSQFVKAFCETLATAKRLGRKGYVQGSDCPVLPVDVFKPDGKTKWFGPIDIVPPTPADIADQARIDARDAAFEKARASGMSEDEIALLRAAY